MPIDAAAPTQPTTAPPDARLAADITDADLTNPFLFRDAVPHDVFDTLRAAGGITWHTEQAPRDVEAEAAMLRFVESPGFWSATRFDLVNTVLRDQSTFSSALGTAFLPTLAPESLDMFRSMMLNMDPPEHSRLRRILQPIFTPKAVQRLYDSVELNATEILDAVDGQDEIDLVPTVSAEMPLRVLADLLGMPREDRHLIFEWSNRLFGIDSPGAEATPASPEEAIGAFTDMMAYGQAMATERRANPRDDIVSTIVNAEVDGERLDDNDFCMFWLLLVIAGNETTRNSLSGSVVALHEHDRWDWLVEDPSRIPAAIEELLRYVSPVMHFRRTATRDVTLGDQDVRAGDKVVVWYGAANRDPEVFENPHGLDLERDPNPHVAFGAGPHFCLGAHLARLELHSMLGGLMARYPELQISGPISRAPSNFISGITELPTRLGPRKAD